MKKVLMPILMIILGLYLILMFINMSADYDKNIENVSFTAISNTSVEEVLYVNQLIYEITDIHINGVHQIVNEVVVSINIIEDGSITLVDNATGSGDLIEITYVYLEPSSEFTETFVNSIPLIMIIIFIGGLAYMISTKR